MGAKEWRFCETKILFLHSSFSPLIIFLSCAFLRGCDRVIDGLNTAFFRGFRKLESILASLTENILGLVIIHVTHKRPTECRGIIDWKGPVVRGFVM